MPLRLTTNVTNLSGHDYADVLGVRYEYPTQYRNLVTTGERFVYYRGRRRPGGGVQPQVYLGTGIVGPVTPSPAKSGHLVCEVEDWDPFAEPLPFKDPEGRYYEPGADQGGLYWQPGVRRIGPDVFDRIVQAAEGRMLSEKTEPFRGRVLLTSYASPAVLRAVDDYAMKAAEKEVRRTWPGLSVATQPHNNPGFDILVGEATHPHRYVEVKGTTLAYPRFFLSEGEREYASSEHSRYTLLVIYAIDLVAKTHEIFRHDGSIGEAEFLLKPRQWVCETRGGL